MLRINEIRVKEETVDFLTELKELLAKHQVTILYGAHHIEFNRPNKSNFAQCFCANGGSRII